MKGGKRDKMRQYRRNNKGNSETKTITYKSTSPIKGMICGLLWARPANTVLEMNDATPGMSLRGLRCSAVVDGVAGLTTPRRDCTTARAAFSSAGKRHGHG